MLIKCPDCGHDVSDAAAACPYCGWPVDARSAAVQTPVRVPAPAEQAQDPAPDRADPAEFPPRFGFPIAAAALYTVYIIFEIVYVRVNGLDSPEIFDDTLTAAFFGGAGTAMSLGILTTALLWAGIGANRSSIFCAGMVFMCIAGVLWLLHVVFVILPIIFGWIGYVKMHRHERSKP